MNFRQSLRRMLHERPAFDRGSMDWEWRTRAARKYVAILRGVPANEWSKW
jgi:hypothetical protein